MTIKTHRIQDLFLSYFEYCFHKTMESVYSFPNLNLTPKPDALFLDIGINNGNYSVKVSEILQTEKIFGMELNAKLALTAKDNGIDVIGSDANDPFPIASNCLDLVCAFNVLEHLVEVHQFLKEIYRVLKPGGNAIINTPNLASWHNIFALCLGLQPFSGPNISSMTESDIPIIRRMHRRAYGLPEHEDDPETSDLERYRHIVVVAFRSLILELRRIGFRIDVARGYGYYPFPPFLARILSRLDRYHTHHIVIKVTK